MIVVAALVIVFCCGCWGFDIKKSPRCVGRLSAVEQNCFTSNYPTISFLEFCQIKIKNVCQIIFLFYRLLVIIHNFQVDAVEFVKDSDSLQLCFTCWIKSNKVIEVNNNSVLHCRTNASFLCYEGYDYFHISLWMCLNYNNLRFLTTFI